MDTAHDKSKSTSFRARQQADEDAAAAMAAEQRYEREHAPGHHAALKDFGGPGLDQPASMAGYHSLKKDADKGFGMAEEMRSGNTASGTRGKEAEDLGMKGGMARE